MGNSSSDVYSGEAMRNRELCPKCAADAAETAARDALIDAMAEFGVMSTQVEDTWNTTHGQAVLAMCRDDAEQAAKWDEGELCHEHVALAAEAAAEDRMDDDRMASG
jgi:hypothetical protein